MVSNAAVPVGGAAVAGAAVTAAPVNTHTLRIHILFHYYYLFIRPNGSTYKIYKSIYKKHTIHSIKENYKLGLQFIYCYEKIAVSTKCRHKLRFSSATPEHRLRIEYFDNILPYSCVHIAEKDRITLLSHVRIFFINSNFR